ncbi:MAG: NAD(P)-dependent oxidoreductase [Candidatus Omnitrophota bacterium]
MVKKSNRQSVLLTGASGFLGSYILEALLDADYPVVVLKRDVSDLWRIKHLLKRVKVYTYGLFSVNTILKKHNIGIIIHAATNYGRGLDNYHEIVDTNVMLPLKILEVARDTPVKAFINIDTLLPAYLSAYSLSKSQFVEWMRFFSPGIQMVNLKIEHFYGPRDDQRKFIVRILSKICRGCSSIALTKGTQKRDFIFVTDVVDAVMLVLKNLQKFNKFSEFQIGTGRSIPIRDFVSLLYDAVKKYKKGEVKTKLDFGAVACRKGEPKEIKADISLLGKLGWKPRMTLSEGIRKTVIWYLNSTTKE